MVNWPYISVFGRVEDEYEPVGGQGFTSVRSRTNKQKSVLVAVCAATLLVVTLSLNVDTVRARNERFPLLVNKASKNLKGTKTVEEEVSTNATKFPCKGWKPIEFMDKEHCETKRKDAIETSLLSALQNENCEAALQSPGNAARVATKLEKLATNNVFTFFRGTAALFDVDIMCYDDNFQKKFEDMPRVFSNGDCHPENFGVMVQANGQLVWGVNDFDQSFQTPFAWDIKRGATGFELACIVRQWDMSKVCTKAASEFARAYVHTFRKSNCTVDNQERFMEGSKATVATQSVEHLIQESRKTEKTKNTKAWLEDDMKIDLQKEEFRRSKKVRPLPKDRIPEFQRAIDAYLYNGVAALAMFPNDGKFFEVKAVAAKYGSGTGSIGLDRYYVLIGGRYTKGKYGHIILEMKEETNSMLQAFFRYQYTASQEGKRAVDSERSAYPYANVFYGWTMYRGKSFIIREKSKHANSVDLDSLTAGEFLEYAMAAGKALAHYHMRARCADHYCNIDDSAAVDKEICHNIVSYIDDFQGSGPHGDHYGPEGLVQMVVDFADVESLRQAEAWLTLKRLVAEKGGDQAALLSLLDSNSEPDY